MVPQSQSLIINFTIINKVIQLYWLTDEPLLKYPVFSLRGEIEICGTSVYDRRH